MEILERGNKCLFIFSNNKAENGDEKEGKV